MPSFDPDGSGKLSSRNLIIGLLIAIPLVMAIATAVMLVARSSEDASSPAQVNGNGAATVGAEAESVVGNMAADEVPIPTKSATDPRWAFVLLGYGGGGHSGAYLTDSIVVAIADPSKKTMTMLSLPRDSWVPILFDGKTPVYNKLNTAYAFATDKSLYRNRLSRYSGGQGAGTLVKDTVSRLLGIPVANYLALDFVGFRSMIDTMGGIDVAVPASFAARYPANDDPSIDSSWKTVRFTKGVEHMTGERAIQFARAREAIDNASEGSDFARSRRQRIIMESFKSSLLRPSGLVHLPQLIGIASKHVDTDYAVPDIGPLGQLALDWKDVRIYQTALSADNFLTSGSGPGGTYVLVPDNADRSWTAIRAFARRLWMDPAAAVAMANTTVTVVNRTGVAGIAGRVSELLAKLGYRVGQPETGSQRTESRILDGSGGTADVLLSYLQSDLGRSIPVQDGDDDTGGVLIEIGTNDLALADAQAPGDVGAPSSAAGVQGSGAWSPPVSAPTPPPATPPPATPSSTATVAPSLPTPTSTPTPRRTATPTRTAGAGATPTPTATASLSPSPRPSRTPTVPRATATIPAPTPSPTVTRRPSATATTVPTATPTNRS